MTSRNTPKPSVKDYLGHTESLIRRGEDGESLPLFIKFSFKVSGDGGAADVIATDEAEVLLAYEDGFVVPGAVDALPSKWRVTRPDPQGFALFKVPADACVGFQHRKLRRRRYHGNVSVRKLAA